MFGAGLDGAVRYAELLASEATVRGLIGPREIARIWDRHLLGSAGLGALVPPGSRVADLGSGAGLPGIPLALAREDLELALVEPLLRRTIFLDRARTVLGLEPRLVVRRMRAEAVQEHFDVVTARALAPLDRLLGLAWPLVGAGGCLLAVKGAKAAAEIADASATLARLDVHAEICVVRPGAPGLLGGSGGLQANSDTGPERGARVEPLTVVRVRAQG